MTPGYLQAFGWPQAPASRKLCLAAALLLACTVFVAALHCTGVDGRSLKASMRRPGSTIGRRLGSVALPAGTANKGWTLGRASYNGLPDEFTKSFVQK